MGLDVADGLAVLWTLNAGVLAVDVSNRGAPRLIGRWEPPGSPNDVLKPKPKYAVVHGGVATVLSNVLVRTPLGTVQSIVAVDVAPWLGASGTDERGATGGAGTNGSP